MKYLLLLVLVYSCNTKEPTPESYYKEVEEMQAENLKSIKNLNALNDEYNRLTFRRAYVMGANASMHAYDKAGASQEYNRLVYSQCTQDSTNYFSP
jgi:hypothetical protein